MRRRNVLGAAMVPLSLPFIHVQKACATKPEVDLFLCLDVSSSMYQGHTVIDEERLSHAEIQKRGHLLALSDLEVEELLIRNRVRVFILGWSSPLAATERINTGTLVTTSGDLGGIRESLRRWSYTCNTGCGTQHSVPIAYALQYFRQDMARRRIFDISTDEGVGNEMREHTAIVRQAAVGKGWTVNAICIGSNANGMASSLQETLVTPDGFVMEVPRWIDYAESLKQKFVRELHIS